MPDPNAPPVSVITAVARQALRAQAAELRDWSVVPLRHEKVIETTGGLYRFSGSARAGGQERPWSAVLKVVIRPEAGCEAPGELCYWRRELLAYRSGLLVGLPGGVRAPRCYGASEDGREAWIWLEAIDEAAPGESPPWSPDDYRRAAYGLGRLAGAYCTGAPVPSQPWLCASLFREMFADGGWWARFIDPAAPENAWQRPVVQAVFSGDLQARVLRLWAEKQRFLQALERLPRVFCHNDAHRRNLMLPESAGGEGDLVAIDWGFCGPGGLGSDLGVLVGTSLSYFAMEPEDAPVLEAAVLDGYAAGLRDAGYSGGSREARLGYLAALALYWGGTLPHAVAGAQPGAARFSVEAKYGRSLAAALPGWSALAGFTLDRAEEARFWMDRLV